MTANWSFAPVCGADYWRVIAFSPEVLIFLFFMITDPKTVPAGRVGRVVFGLLVAVASTLLMATQTDEFGTKVGLLAGLVVLCAARPLLDRVLPEPRSAADDLRLRPERRRDGRGRDPRMAARGALVVAAVLVLGVGIFAVGAPARAVAAPDVAAVLSRVPHQVDPGTFPTISVEQDVGAFDISLLGPGAQQLVLTMAENLMLENEAPPSRGREHPHRGRSRRPAGGDAGSSPAGGRDRDHHARVVHVRRRHDVPRGAVRAAERPERRSRSRAAR